METLKFTFQRRRDLLSKCHMTLSNDINFSDSSFVFSKPCPSSSAVALLSLKWLKQSIQTTFTKKMARWPETRAMCSMACSSVHRQNVTTKLLLCVTRLSSLFFTIELEKQLAEVDYYNWW